MKKIFLVILILLIPSSIYYLATKTSKKENDVSYMPYKADYKIVKDFIEANGQIEPLNRIEIVPPSGGRIERIFVEEGTYVESGKVLCLMSSSDRVAILDAARSISEEEYKKWQDAYKPIQVLAPISGRIILRNVVEGQTVSGGTVLFAMSDTLIATANIDESDIGKVKIGQTAYITLDAYPNTQITGKIFQILDEGKNVSGVIIYKVKIKLDKIPPFLKSQMTTNTKILISERKVLAIPSKAVEYSTDGKTYVITGFDDKKQPTKKEIKIGKDYDEIVEVKDGLSKGDEIYIKVIKYKKQKIDNGKNPFVPQRSKNQPKGIMRRI